MVMPCSRSATRPSSSRREVGMVRRRPCGRRRSVLALVVDRGRRRPTAGGRSASTCRRRRSRRSGRVAAMPFEVAREATVLRGLTSGRQRWHLLEGRCAVIRSTLPASSSPWRRPDRGRSGGRRVRRCGRRAFRRRRSSSVVGVGFDGGGQRPAAERAEADRAHLTGSSPGFSGKRSSSCMRIWPLRTMVGRSLAR